MKIVSTLQLSALLKKYSLATNNTKLSQNLEKLIQKRPITHQMSSDTCITLQFNSEETLVVKAITAALIRDEHNVYTLFRTSTPPLFINSSRILTRENLKKPESNLIYLKIPVSFLIPL